MLRKQPPSIEFSKTLYEESQLFKLNLDVSYAGNQHAQEWLINWGDGTTSKRTVLTDRLSFAHYYKPSDTTKTYPITVTLVDSNGHGGQTKWSLGGHTVSASTKTYAIDQVTEPQLQVAQSVEEVVLAKHLPDTGKLGQSAFISTGIADKSLVSSLRVDLDMATSSRLLYWNTRQDELSIKERSTNRFDIPAVNRFTLALAPVIQTLPIQTIPVAEWSLFDEDFDFDCDNPAASTASIDAIIQDWDEGSELLEETWL